MPKAASAAKSTRIPACRIAVLVLTMAKVASIDLYQIRSGELAVQHPAGDGASIVIQFHGKAVACNLGDIAAILDRPLEGAPFRARPSACGPDRVGHALPGSSGGAGIHRLTAAPAEP